MLVYGKYECFVMQMLYVCEEGNMVVKTVLQYFSLTY